MIDFHNHVLPNVDDGPKTIEESIDMLRHASSQGITEIVQTVHFQHPKMEGKNIDYEYLLMKTKEIQDKINEENLNIKLHLSAEVFYLPNLVEISVNKLVTVGNKKYMLIEFSNNIFPDKYEEEFYKLQKTGITPIIAHPERYRFIQNDLNILDMWKDRGFIIQIDAGSILGHFGVRTKKNAIEMINKGCVHIIGSDAHKNKKRNFCLKEAYDFLENNYSADLVNILKNNVIAIISGHSKNKISDLEQIKKNANLKDKIFKLCGL